MAARSQARRFGRRFGTVSYCCLDDEHVPPLRPVRLLEQHRSAVGRDLATVEVRHQPAPLRDWLLEKDWEAWDRQIEQGSSGKLEELFESCRPS